MCVGSGGKHVRVLRQWAELFGRFVIELLQQNTLGIEQFIHEAEIEYIDGKPMLKSAAISKAEGECQHWYDKQKCIHCGKIFTD